jgi:alkanesulfonate monooxygenase SsuD/methylene tetrahydromethanopterin reductase-like flavin-dependent oxidoreductase (luciferase family)
MDHWFQMERVAPATDPMLEGYTALGFVAGCTESLRLRLLVTGVTYRHPGLLAKTVTTLDVLSGGRAELGIGAAWYDREHHALGVPSRHSPNASNAWRRRCRSASRCGATTTDPSTAATTSWPRRCACRRL